MKLLFIFQLSGRAVHREVVEHFTEWAGEHRFGILNKNKFLNCAEESSMRESIREIQTTDGAPQLADFIERVHILGGETTKPVIAFMTVLPFRPQTVPTYRHQLTHCNVLIVFPSEKKMVIFEPFFEDKRRGHVLQSPYTEVNRLSLLLGFPNGDTVAVINGHQPWEGPGSLSCYENCWDFVYQLHVQCKMPDTSHCPTIQIAHPPRSYLQKKLQ